MAGMFEFGKISMNSKKDEKENTLNCHFQDHWNLEIRNHSRSMNDNVVDETILIVSIL